MDAHEFGILPKTPEHGERYDTYDAKTYDCISIPDEDLYPLLWDMEVLSCYSHTVDIPCHGLVYCGITLIPPTAAREMLWMTKPHPALAPLTVLLDKAEKENRFVIHYGL